MRMDDFGRVKPPAFNKDSTRELRSRIGDGISQNDLARVLGCTSNTVANWENGRFEPSGAYIDQMYKLCRKYGIDPPPEFYLYEDESG